MSQAEKRHLDTAAYLIRSFRIDYEKGTRSVDSRMRVTRAGNRYVFTPVDSMIVYTNDGTLLEKNYYDKLGQLTRLQLYSGSQPNQLITELVAHDTIVNGQLVRYQVVKNGFYPNGQAQTIEWWIRAGNKTRKHGKWEYYNADGNLQRTVRYEQGKKAN
jgi:hypothetical protein